TGHAAPPGPPTETRREPPRCGHRGGTRGQRSTAAETRARVILIIPLVCIVLLWVALIYLNERYQLFSVDQFSSPAMKWMAYVWLGLFLFLLTFLIVGSSRHPPTA